MSFNISVNIYDNLIEIQHKLVLLDKLLYSRVFVGSYCDALQLQLKSWHMDRNQRGMAYKYILFCFISV